MLKKKLLAYIHYIQSQTGTLTWFYGNPCYLTGITKTLINNYKVFGKSEQVGTPEPENPVEIKSVGDKTTQLLDISEPMINSLSELLAITKPTYGRTNATLATEIYVGQVITFASSCKGIVIPCKQGDTFSIKLFGTTGIGRPYYTEIDKDGIVLYIRKGFNVNGDTITVSESSAKFLCIEWSIDTVDEAKAVVVEGSTVPTEYIPYGYKIPVKVSKPLPEGYTELDYVKVPYVVDYKKSPYIRFTDTPLNNKKIGVILDFKLNTAHSGDILIGSSFADNTQNYRFGLWQSAGVQWRTKINSVGYYSGVFDTNRHKLHFNMPYGTKLDNTIIDSNQYTILGDEYLTLFQDTISNAYSSPDADVYGGEVYDEETLIKNLVPALEDSTNKVGFYDTINNEFVGNTNTSSTAEFIAGTEAEPEYTVTDVYLSQPLRSIGIPHGVPKEYQELSYIESTGEQYIDLGIVPDTENDRIVADVQFLGSISSYVLMGRAQSAKGLGFGLKSDRSFMCSADGDITTTVIADVDGRYTFDVDAKNKTFKVYKDGVEIVSSVITTASIVNTETTTLFCVRSSNGNLLYFSVARIFSCQYYSNGILSHDYRPAKKLANSELGLFDTITRAFKTNSGTGTFVAGPPIFYDYIDYETKKVYRQVGYKEFDGTETWGIGSPSQFVYNTMTDISTDASVAMSSHFRYKESFVAGSSYNQFGFRSTRNGVWISVENLTTVQQYKDFLAAQKNAGTPVTLTYPLATPTEETITLPQLSVPLGDSVVTTDTEVQPSDIQIQGSV